jgi:hypothetical protein
VFFPTIQAKTGLNGFALLAIEKGFEQESLCSDMASFVQRWKDSRGVLGLRGVLGSFWTKSV